MSGFALSLEERRGLLKLALSALTARVERGETYIPEESEITDGMRQQAGAFVTLHRQGALRGCIGEIYPSRAVYAAVLDHAVNAAVHDPRFPSVQAEELPSIELEISVLTPPHRIDSWREIEIGRHGVVLRKRGRSAVFLPQVAPEQGWDVETMLAHLALKAGLSADAWWEGAVFEVFEAIVFSERAFGSAGQ